MIIRELIGIFGIFLRRVVANLNDSYKGYNHPILTKTLIEKTQSRSLSDRTTKISTTDALLLSLIGGVAADANQRIIVLDIGGGAGIHYITIRNAYQKPLDWRVIETPSMCAGMQPYLNEELKYYDSIQNSIESDEECMIVTCNSSLQYFDFPEKAISELLELAPKFILIQRFPLHEEERVVISQTSLLSDNGPGKLSLLKDRKVIYPLTIINYAAFMELMSQKYTLLVKTIDLHSMPNIGLHNISQYTFIFARKLASE